MSVAFSSWMKTADFTDFSNQRELLFQLGHFIAAGYWPNKPGDEMRLASEVLDSFHPFFREATESYQRFSQADGRALLTDKDFGPVTAKSVGQRFCSCADILPATSRWSFNDLNVWWRGPNDLGYSDIKDRWLEAVGVWAKYTPLTVRWWKESDGGNGPNIYCDTQRIDGPNQVLAYMYLPSAGAPRTEKNQMVIDTSENWKSSNWFLPRVIEHEAGHAYGLGHIPNQGNNRALMNPYIQQLDGPQPLDIAAIQKLYGKKPTDPGPDPDDPPSDDGESVEIFRWTLPSGKVASVRMSIEG